MPDLQALRDSLTGDVRRTCGRGLNVAASAERVCERTPEQDERDPPWSLVGQCRLPSIEAGYLDSRTGHTSTDYNAQKSHAERGHVQTCSEHVPGRSMLGQHRSSRPRVSAVMRKL